MTAPQTASRRPSIVVLVLVLVVSGLLVWRTVRDGRPAAEVGAVVVAADPITGGERHTVRIPIGEYEVRSTVRDDVPDDLAVRERQAPDGGSFVGVSLARVDAPNVFMPSFVRPGTATKDPTPVPVLVVDGRRYPLTTEDDDDGDLPTSVPLAVYVAVAGKARSLQLEMAWDGRSQRVDLRTGVRDAGAFAPLYRADAGASDYASCGAPTWPAGDRADVGQAAGCRWAADRQSYVLGKGWAPVGRQWLVLRVTTTPPAGFVHRLDGRDVRYFSRFSDVTTDRARHRLDGRAPVTSFRSSYYTENRGDTLLFDVPANGPAPVATLVQRVQGFARTTDDVVVGTQTWTVRV